MKTRILIIFFIMGTVTKGFPQSLTDTLTQKATPALEDTAEVMDHSTAAADTAAPFRDSVKTETAKEPALLIQTKKDTVFMIADDEFKEIVANAHEKLKKSRQQGYGGAGGWTPGFMVINLRPINDMINREDVFNSVTFPGLKHNYRPISTGGGMGYGGIGNGVRIGGGGFGGEMQVRSDPYDRTGSGSDSVSVLRIRYGYGGFLIEKAIVKENLNLMTGGMIAFGSVRVSYESYDEENSSAFSSDHGFDGENKAEADIVGLELHTGFTYTLTSWMHLGGDVNAFVGYSADGFEGAGNMGFMAMYPGVKFRIIFGNLG